MRLVARYADACNLSTFVGTDMIRHKPDGAGGQDHAGGDRVVPRLGEAGEEPLIIQLPNVHEIGPIETVGEEIIPAVAEL